MSKKMGRCLTSEQREQVNVGFDSLRLFGSLGLLRIGKRLKYSVAGPTVVIRDSLWPLSATELTLANKLSVA